MVIESIYKPNLEEECAFVLGSTDSNHPYHDIIMQNTNKYYIGGTVRKICLPIHYDFVDLRFKRQGTDHQRWCHYPQSNVSHPPHSKDGKPNTTLTRFNSLSKFQKPKTLRLEMVPPLSS